MGEGVLDLWCSYFPSLSKYFVKTFLEFQKISSLPQYNNPHEWLQVDLGTVKRITGVLTQGATSLLTPMMVTEFSVTISHNGRSWNTVLEENSQREEVHHVFQYQLT